MKKITVNELRDLLLNAWAAGYVAKAEGVEAPLCNTVRANYVERHMAPYVEEPKEPKSDFDLYAYLGVSKEDVHAAMDDFFFSGLRDTCVKSGRPVPEWMHL